MAQGPPAITKGISSSLSEASRGIPASSSILRRLV